MIEIIPAIIPQNYDDLQDKMSIVAGLVPMVQVDVMDGIFVPSKSWPYNKAATSGADPSFSKILNEEDGFPFWDEVDYEADLMVSDPVTAAKDWVKAGAKRIIVHVESVADPVVAIEEIKKVLPSEGSILYTEIGVAINPETSIETLDPLLATDGFIDFVQFMGIQKIGFQGEKFNEGVLEKVSTLRAKHPKATISVDGGVNLDTAPKLIAAGVNRLAIGSAIFAQEDPQAALEEFFAIANPDGETDGGDIEVTEE